MVGLEEAPIRQMQPAQALATPAQLVQHEIVHARLPAIFAAQPLDGRADALDHRDETEGADMRMRLGQYVVGRAGVHELLQHLAAEEARVLDPAIELAVREGPAPPSPNWTLLSGLSTARRHRPHVSLVRSRTTLPRSRMIGPQAHLRQQQPPPAVRRVPRRSPPDEGPSSPAARSPRTCSRYPAGASHRDRRLAPPAPPPRRAARRPPYRPAGSRSSCAHRCRAGRPRSSAGPSPECPAARRWPAPWPRADGRAGA